MLDLDVLEREWRTNPEKWPVESLRLIVRLRDAEALIERLDRVRDEAQRALDDLDKGDGPYFGGLRSALKAAEGGAA